MYVYTEKMMLTSTILEKNNANIIIKLAVRTRKEKKRKEKIK